MPRPVAAYAPFAEEMFTVGITGTNGKTSTTLMLVSMLRAAGLPTCFETTLGGGTELDALGSTDREPFVQRARAAHAEGVRHLAVEVTSEALARGWSKRWRFDLGVFTNLSRDHLDAHGNFEHYLASKAQLFVHLGPGRTAVLNAADPCSRLLDRVIPGDVQRRFYAAPTRGTAHFPPDLAVQELEVRPDGTRARLAPSVFAEQLAGTLELALIGHVFVENALAATLAGLALGLSPNTVQCGLRNIERLPGRFEVIARTPLVAIDYAHTPDALSQTLATARGLANNASQGRVIAVFGAGGNRDQAKRRPMGEAVGKLADYAIITNDNPRNEDPRAIAQALAAGCRRGGRAHARIVLDRRQAIQQAIESARPHDVVVICGKGHETGQAIGGAIEPFDDAATARSILRPGTL
jgi:UDP-N-acetylmuramoyl-L-alanyl-D-glutamate--2,6-diaminopimelate ligase